jgi:hypothetical protein
MFLGVALNVGKGFPIEDDAGAAAFLDELEGQPVFVGMQGEGREWVDLVSPEVRARFDYVFTDSMTFTDQRGRRTRLWIPEEVEVGDSEAFMDLLVEKTVGVLEDESIDVYVNPTFLPEVIADRYDALWTEERMRKVVAAAVANGVAIEINARHRLPGERFLRLAREAGAKFTFGTNNAGADDFGDWADVVPGAAELGDEAPAGAQRTEHALHDGVRPPHPVEGGVAEYGVELPVEGERLAVGDARVESAAAGGLDLLGARVHGHHVAPGLDQDAGEPPVAAAEVEDALTRAGREQVDQIATQLRHEARVALVAHGVPALLRRRVTHGGDYGGAPPAQRASSAAMPSRASERSVSPARKRPQWWRTTR